LTILSIHRNQGKPHPSQNIAQNKQTMKKHIIPITILFLIATSCHKEEIRVYNTQNTPDLSNPVIQKFTNTIWFKNGLDIQHWASSDNIYKSSEMASFLLYQMAWRSLTLYRDGTSNMVFLPPFSESTAIHCKGNWKVSTEEENTIILSTKTPVTSVTGKIKILYLETKEELGVAKVSVDFGDRLLTTSLYNEDPWTDRPAYVSAVDYDWFAAQQIQTDPLRAEDFIGAWKSSEGRDDLNKTLLDKDFPLEHVRRATYMEDLLMQTPNILLGMTFNLRENGKAQLAYHSMLTDFYKKHLNITENIVSDAQWSVRGNKIYIETDEELHYAIGEGLFKYKSSVPGLIYIGERAQGGYSTTPLYILPNKQRYILELISRNEEGFWARITTKTGVFWLFLFKTEFDGDNTINIREAHRSN